MDTRVSIYDYQTPVNSNRSLEVPAFGTDYEASIIGPLGYDRVLSEAEVRAREADPSYQEYTRRMAEEIDNNTEIGQNYTKAFHQQRAKNAKYASEYTRESDGTYKYIGPANSLFNADGSFVKGAWLKGRIDGKWGLIHESGFSEDELQITHGTKKTPKPTQSNKNPFTYSFGVDLQSPQKSRWTDYLPILSKYFTNKAAAIKDANLQSELSFPKQLPKQRNAIKTDAYLQRQLLEKQKQELLAKADNIRVSNIDDKLRIMDQVNEVAGKYSDRQAALQTQEYQTTSSDVTKAENFNISERTDSANHNMKVASVAKNNLINANRARIAKEATNINNTVDSLYHNYGKWLHDQRLNNQRQQELSLAAMTNEALAGLKTQLTDRQDPSAWEQLTNFAVALTDPSANLTQEEADLLNKWRANHQEGIKTDAAYRNLLLSKLATGSDPISVNWRAAWEDYQARLQQQHDAKATEVRSEYQRQLAAMPTIIDNQIATYTPRRKESSLMKEGGKLKWLKAQANKNQKEKEQHEKSFTAAQKESTEALRHKLDALDKEQLLLLKAVFS